MAKKILLADDSITIQKVVSLTLADGDYELVTVSDGESAVEKAREIKPDLIMADVAMPGKSGYEVCETVKNDPDLKGIPVLLLAGTFDTLDAEEAQRVGADDHIVKPFESEELTGKVQELLARTSGSQVAEEDAEQPQTTEAVWEAGDFLEVPDTEPFSFEEEEPSLSLEPAAEEGGDEGFFELELTEEDFVQEVGFGGEEPASAPGEDAFGETPGPRPQGADTEGPTLSGVPEQPSVTEESKDEPAAPADEQPVEPDAFETPGVPSTEGPAEPSAGEPFEGPSAAAEEGPGAEETGPFEMLETPFVTEGPGESEEEPTAQTDEQYVEPDPFETPGAPSTEETEESEQEPAPLTDGPDAELTGKEREELTIATEEWMPQAAEEAPEGVAEEASPAEHDVTAKPAPFEAAAGEVGGAAVTAPSAADEVETEGVSLPRERIEEIVERVAREVIEEIAWEVVPDLTEEIIKTEFINRIREVLGKPK